MANTPEETLEQSLEDVRLALVLGAAIPAMPGMTFYRVTVQQMSGRFETPWSKNVGFYPTYDEALLALSRWCVEQWRDTTELEGEPTPWSEGLPEEEQGTVDGRGPVSIVMEYVDSHTPIQIVDRYFAEFYHEYTIEEEKVETPPLGFLLS